MSQRLVKLATSLQHKKFRNKEKLFVAEGEKLVLDLLADFQPKYLLCTKEWATKHQNMKTTVIAESLLKKASSFKNVSPVIGLFQIPKSKPVSFREFPFLVLDTIQDPGNLGTIIRTAAWFGIKHIFCSEETVDTYSPKVVQATMGALGKVEVHYLPLAPFMEELQAKDISILGTFLEGEDIYKTSLPKKSAIVIGNEGRGISEELKPFINHPIHIPAFTPNPPESLNASVSVAIVCSELMKGTTQN